MGPLGQPGEMGPRGAQGVMGSRGPSGLPGSKGDQVRLLLLSFILLISLSF